MTWLERWEETERRRSDLTVTKIGRPGWRHGWVPDRWDTILGHRPSARRGRASERNRSTGTCGRTSRGRSRRCVRSRRCIRCWAHLPSAGNWGCASTFPRRKLCRKTKWASTAVAVAVVVVACEPMGWSGRLAAFVPIGADACAVVAAAAEDAVGSYEEGLGKWRPVVRPAVRWCPGGGLLVCCRRRQKWPKVVKRRQRASKVWRRLGSSSSSLRRCETGGIRFHLPGSVREPHLWRWPNIPVCGSKHDVSLFKKKRDIWKAEIEITDRGAGRHRRASQWTKVMLDCKWWNRIPFRRRRWILSGRSGRPTTRPDWSDGTRGRSRCRIRHRGGQLSGNRVPCGCWRRACGGGTSTVERRGGGSGAEAAAGGNSGGRPAEPTEAKSIGCRGSAGAAASGSDEVRDSSWGRSSKRAGRLRCGAAAFAAGAAGCCARRPSCCWLRRWKRSIANWWCSSVSANSASGCCSNCLWDLEKGGKQNVMNTSTRRAESENRRGGG